MVGIDFALLDLPRNQQIEDPDAFLRSVLAWHFGTETGSAYWLRKIHDLDFNPLTDIQCFADLRLFPDIAGELRDVPVSDLIPRGYGSSPSIAQVFESGGTTGAPKRTIQTPDLIEQNVRWQTADFRDSGYAMGRGLLGMLPSGPHAAGYHVRATAERLGSVYYAIDLDPRWVKKLVARGAGGEMAAYVDHLVEQSEYVLRTQDIGNIFTTPPILQAMARRDNIVDLINSKTRWILLAGAHLDPDTHDLLCEIFADTTIAMTFGNTMTLAPTSTRAPRATSENGTFIYDPHTPYVVFWVIDTTTGEVVPYGERGRLVTNHLSKTMFIPNNLERDTAVRVPGRPGQVGDSISAVEPVDFFEGEAVIEGVY